MNDEHIKPAFIVDADDTLWETETFYQRAISDFGDLMATLDFDRAEAKRTLDVVERERVLLTGYGPQAFAQNMVVAYERLCENQRRPAVQDVAARVLEIGQTVVEFPINLLEGVAETLPWLAARFRLFLLTKGDRAAQEDKLNRSGLAHFFEAVHIVPEKDARVLRELIARHGLAPQQTWMVGNSPRSDINPALEAGIRAVHIPHTCTWVWEQAELVAPERVVVLNHFGELTELFAVGRGF